MDLKNRGIGRARMFMGALLLLAAALTWGIGLMMSPHGETVARGTEHLRSTIVTFKRNGAIGTLILCAISAWLLFPRRRPKWPARDWALMTLFAMLTGTSIYTLIWLHPSVANTVAVDENYAITDLNLDWTANAAAPGPGLGSNPGPTAGFNHSDGPRITAGLAGQPKDTQAQSASNGTAEQPILPEEQSDAEGNAVSDDAGDEPANEATDQNQE